MKKSLIIALCCINTFYTTHTADKKDVATKVLEEQHLKAELEAAIVKEVQQACKLYVKTGKISSILSPQDIDTLQPARNQHVLNTLQHKTATSTRIGLSSSVFSAIIK